LNFSLSGTLCTLSDYYFKDMQRLSVLIYHRVLESYDYMRPGEPTRAEFSWQMETIAKCLNPLSLSEAMDRLDSGTLPPRAVCITFDDGYADNRTIALPILKRLKIPATVFIATGYLNGGRMWNDTVIESIRESEGGHLDLSRFNMGEYQIGTDMEKYQAALQILQKTKYLDLKNRSRVLDILESCARPLRDDLMLTSSQIVELVEAGIEIGGHTRNHPIMTTLSLDEVTKELESNRAELESITSRPVEYFAYPNGKGGQDFNGEHRDLVEHMGFRAAFSTDWGVSNANTDRFQLPRFTPWDKSEGRFLARLLCNQKNLV
jgi:peptidoglycan/xylan/chitin deacetylase (PgdA/CDA1 family)